MPCIPGVIPAAAFDQSRKREKSEVANTHNCFFRVFASFALSRLSLAVVLTVLATQDLSGQTIPEILRTAMALRTSARSDSAIILYRQVLAIRDTSGDERGKAASLATIGSVFQETGRPDSARVYLERAVRQWRIARDAHGEAVTLDQLGQLHLAGGQVDSAALCLEAALGLFEQVGDPEGQSQALDHIGSVWLARQQPDSAISYYREALNLLEMVGAEARMALVEQHLERARELAGK